MLRLSILLLTSSVGLAQVDFQRDVRPILADRCFACHGPDAAARKARLRLDVREDALAALDLASPHASLLLERVTADEGERMPPLESKKPALTAREVDVLRRWIAAGAEYTNHWSYEPIEATLVPETGEPHPIDAFLARQWRVLGQQPSPPADPRTLIRRLSFDLTGLPPTPERVDASAAARSAEFERSSPANTPASRGSGCATGTPKPPTRSPRTPTPTSSRPMSPRCSNGPRSPR